MTTQTQRRGSKLLQQRHHEMIADIQDRLQRISKWIDGEAQNENYNWTDIGDLVYIQEQLQRITDFHHDL
ncbi:MAG: hypothetical protein JW963_06405 [Anaerolineales bacterium]|nr:hypothetical protein [Anaerolineales bacterium]